MDILRAVGAEVVVCPTDVEPTDPRSYYSVSKRLATEIPNSWYVNQYDNPSNAIAHYEQTGPEIWKQTEGKITHFIVGVGTGGTISGVGKYLKEQNPNIKIWGIDTYGSVFKKYHETGIFDENEIYSYITEGIGEDILPKNVDFSLIDGFTKVTDKDAAVYTRKIAEQEGIFVGNSAGAAIKGLLQLKEHFKPSDVIVVLFHDSGSRYVGKMFNDDWMREKGFLDEEIKTAYDIVKNHHNPLVIVRTEELVSHAIDRLKKHRIAQIPVVDATNNFVGSIDETTLFESYVENKDIGDRPIRSLMGKPYPVVHENTSIDEVAQLFTNDNNAVIVKLANGAYQLITKHDIISTV
jgi:cystathionine beta-synthase